MSSAKRGGIRLRPGLVVLGVLVAALLVPAVASAQLSVLAATSNNTTLSGAVSVGVSPADEAYATAYYPGQLTAVNISNPQIPHTDGSTAATPAAENGTNVAFDGSYAFMVSKNRNASASSNDDGSGNSFTIADLTTPASPTLVGSPLQDASHLFGSYGVAVPPGSQYAYVAYQGTLLGQPSSPDTSSGGFSIINLNSATSPSSPTIIGNIDNSSLTGQFTNALQHATSVAVSGNYAFVTAFYNASITVIDISNKTNPQVVATLHDPTHLPFPVDLAVQGNYLYVANQVGGSSPQLTVVNIMTPGSPTVVGSINKSVLNGAYRIRVSGDFAYLAASSASTVGVIDISNPVAPRLADYVQDAGHLFSTTGLDLDTSKHYVIASSPRLSTESNATYPPFTNTTGTISVISLIPNTIAATIAPSSEPPNPTTQTTASFSFSVNDTVSAVQCQLDAGAYLPCTSPTTQNYSGLATGSHTFTIQATDAAGNQTTASYTWQVVPGAPVPGSPGPSITDQTHATGNPQVGDTLNVSNGTWTSTSPIAYTYQWQQCTTTCTNIASNATGQTYTVQPSDLGTTLQAIVTATNTAGSGTATSSPTATVVGPPQNTGPPTLTIAGNGVAAVGNQIAASNGTWNGTAPISYAYKWLRCSPGCAAISGATNSTYTPVAADGNQTLEVQVTASNGFGSAQATSAQTAAVVLPPSIQLAPVISGTVQPGQKVVVSKGAWSPTPTSYAVQWYDCKSGACSAISGATNGTYRIASTDIGFALEAIVSAYDASPVPGKYTVGPTSVVSSLVPANTGLPVINGSTTVGQTLNVTHGTWTNSPTSYAAQWLRCSSASCGVISGATHGSYVLTPADLGHTLEAVVTASNAHGSSSVTVGPTAVITAPGRTSNVGRPTIAGTRVVGGTLQAQTGLWVGSVDRYSYQWLLCRKYCLNISGATKYSYAVQPGDLGGGLEVAVTAHSVYAPATARSTRTGLVYPAPATVDKALGKLLTPRGKAASLASVRRHGFRFTITAPSAGKLVLSWYYLPKGASLIKPKRKGPKPVLIATVTVTFSGSSQRKTMTIKLTKAGKQRLAKARKISLTTQAAFLPAGGPWVYQRRGFGLK